MKPRLALLAALALVVSPNAFADQFEQARAWLERMAVAMRERTYEGTFVYVRGEDVETIRLTHALDGGVVQERLVALSGPPREVIRDGSGLRAVEGEEDAALLASLGAGALMPDFTVDALDRARGRYLFEIGGVSRIAGHQGRQLTITPRDMYRYGYELWLEDETALLLRWVVYDPDRKPLAKLMFTELVVGPALEGALPTGAAPGVERPDGAAAQPAASSFPTADLGLPPGFALAAHMQDESMPAAEHLVFSDGLASISVYLEPFQPAAGLPDGFSRFGTTNAWTQRVDDRRVTVLGEVPTLTLKAFGAAFVRRELAD